MARRNDENTVEGSPEFFGEQGYKVAELIAAGKCSEARRILYPLYRVQMKERFAQTALLLQILSKYFVKVGNVPEAVNLLIQAQQLCEFADESLAQIRILNDLGELCITDPGLPATGAFEYFLRAFDLWVHCDAEKVSEDSSSEEAIVYKAMMKGQLFRIFQGLSLAVPPGFLREMLNGISNAEIFVAVGYSAIRALSR